jgi:hypothetical protein
MRICTLDLSKRSAGWATWAPGDAKPVSGVWVLGTEFTSKGLTYCKLHERLSDLSSVGRIEALFWEDPLDARLLTGHTNIDSIRVLGGLTAHAASWGEAMGCRHARGIHMAAWRREFLGPMKRGTKSADLKEMAMERCRQFGFKPQKHDEAEALGIMDWATDMLGIATPWRAARPLPLVLT